MATIYPMPPAPPVTLRPATPADSGFAYAAKRAAFRPYVEQVWGWDEDEQRRLHQRRFDAQDVRIILAGDTPAGYAALRIDSDCLHLHQLFLLPEHQGRGIGRAVMELLLGEARALRLSIRLRVLHVNPRATAFYERLGFRITGRTETHVMMESSPTVDADHLTDTHSA